MWLFWLARPPSSIHLSPPPLFVDYNFDWQSLHLDWPLQLGFKATFVLTLSSVSATSLSLALMHEGLFLSHLLWSCLSLLSSGDSETDTLIKSQALLHAASTCLQHMAHRSLFHVASRLVLEYIMHYIQYIYIYSGARVTDVPYYIQTNCAVLYRLCGARSGSPQLFYTVATVVVPVPKLEYHHHIFVWGVVTHAK